MPHHDTTINDHPDSLSIVRIDKLSKAPAPRTLIPQSTLQKWQGRVLQSLMDAASTYEYFLPNVGRLLYGMRVSTARLQVIRRIYLQC